ncbi:Uncharacterized protein Fot_05959 [Forsythia ovata]|uniref:Uncharacterized protein n=1 Tax=Forsythia ovata TaxID=205694 RepID=A0ABD1WS63_9LAMI
MGKTANVYEEKGMILVSRGRFIAEKDDSTYHQIVSSLNRELIYKSTQNTRERRFLNRFQQYTSMAANPSFSNLPLGEVQCPTWESEQNCDIPLVVPLDAIIPSSRILGIKVIISA